MRPRPINPKRIGKAGKRKSGENFGFAVPGILRSIPVNEVTQQTNPVTASGVKESVQTLKAGISTGKNFWGLRTPKTVMLYIHSQADRSAGESILPELFWLQLKPGPACELTISHDTHTADTSFLQAKSILSNPL